MRATEEDVRLTQSPSLERNPYSNSLFCPGELAFESSSRFLEKEMIVSLHLINLSVSNLKD
jgi:hypothetical protein